MEARPSHYRLLGEPRYLAPLRLLLRNYARAFAAALDVDALADLEVRVARLGHLHQHAALHAEYALLSRLRLVVLLRHVVPQERAAQRAGAHRHVASGPRADQAADSQPAEAADDRADACVMVALHLHIGDLLDHALAN